ncbi:MAG TPA: ferrous iron transport protein B [Candidatus Eisenbacteria bacterium]|nr:ferrous iron transport protein B [Candidatus Eisenbacteria bacterium]
MSSRSSLAPPPRGTRNLPLSGRVPHAARRHRLVAVVGNPNSGKSTLFNRLTGLRQKVANYPGVTVDVTCGRCPLPSGTILDLVDLPGAYSLRPRSPDEEIVRDVLLGVDRTTPSPDAILLVLDASNLDRHLFLALQVLDLQRPAIVVLNMVDVAREQGLLVDRAALERLLGVRVFETVGRTGEGVDAVRAALEGAIAAPAAPVLAHPAAIASEVRALAANLSEQGAASGTEAERLAWAFLCDESDALARRVAPAAADQARAHRERLDQHDPEWRAQEAARGYEAVERMLAAATRKVTSADPVRRRVDRIVTHRIFGPLLFAIVMGVIFQAIYAGAQPIMDLIERGVAWAGAGITAALPPGPFRSLLVDGILAGAGTVLSFLPQIALLFLFIGLLEDTGYLARAAFILDRLMGAVGLPGRAFLPLLSSFACAIPGILATRTIENRRDRLATIFVAPFMSCSARLPVYALLIGAFIPNLGWGPLSLPGLVLFLLYAFGIAVAFVTAWALRRTVLRGPRASSVMELPPYRTPAWRGLFVTIRSQSLEFVKKAGTIIVAVSAVLWFLASYPGGAPETRAIEGRLVAAERSGDEVAAEALRHEAAGSALRHSFAGRIGHALEPVIEPLGFDWKIGIGLVTSFAAREVMVSTMATVWNMGNADENAVSLRQAMREAKDPATGRAAYPPLTGISLMVFFALACQCMSTVAVVRRETRTWTWPLLMLVSMNVLAWIASFAVFQGGRALGWGV